MLAMQESRGPVPPATPARRDGLSAHNLKVIGSNPIPATTFIITHLPSRSNRRDGSGSSRNAEASDKRSGCVQRR